MKHIRRSQSFDNDQGSALAVMTVMVTVMAGTACILLTMVTGGHKEQRQTGELLRARSVCEAGLSQAMFNVQRGVSGAVGTQQNPVAWGQAEYFVTQSQVADVISLRATGVDDRKGACMELVVREVPNTIWRFGAFGKEFMHLDSNARVDSYDSTLGTYASQAVNGSGSNQHANTNGDVGSNGDVSMKQNSKVWGDALAGPDHSTTVLGNAVCTGSTTPMPDPIEMPALNVPTYVSSGALTVSSNTTIASGNRKYTNMTVNNNKTLTINGPANVVITNLTLKSGSALKVNTAGGAVTLWIIDDFIMNSNAFMGPLDLKPEHLTVNLLSDNVINPEVAIDLDEIDFNSNTKLYGTIYAPNAAITVNSNFELFGSVMSRSVDLNSNATVHFDEHLIDATALGAPTFETICWRELPYSGN